MTDVANHSPQPDLVSVVLPTYNRAHCITRAIDSALGQIEADVEIILVDDGSTDDTAALISARYGDDPRVRYFHKPNGGVAAARNHGLKQVRGSFVALLDSDDVWEPWKLQLQLAAFAAVPHLRMVWTDMQAVDPAGKQISPAYLRTMYNCWDKFPDPASIFDHAVPIKSLISDPPPAAADSWFRYGEIFTPMFLGSLVHTSSVLARRDCVDRVGKFDESMGISGEDYDFYFRICGDGVVGLLDVSALRYEIGKADRLTNHSAIIATNALRTIRRALREDRPKIRLSAAAIRARFAEVHAWLAEASLEDGNRPTARRNFMRSLSYQPFQPRCMRLLGLACVPPAVGLPLRNSFRRLKRRLAT